MAVSFTEQKRLEAIGYFKGKKAAQEEERVFSESLLKAMWEILDRIYGDNPQYRKIEDEQSTS